MNIDKLLRDLTEANKQLSLRVWTHNDHGRIRSEANGDLGELFIFSDAEAVVLLRNHLPALLEHVGVLTKERDDAQGVLASVTDSLNRFCREEGVQQTEKYLTLDVRDGIDWLVYRMRRKLQAVDAARNEAVAPVVVAEVTPEYRERDGCWNCRYCFEDPAMVYDDCLNKNAEAPCDCQPWGTCGHHEPEEGEGS
jgi:hypothetical protein